MRVYGRTIEDNAFIPLINEKKLILLKCTIDLVNKIHTKLNYVKIGSTTNLSMA